MEAEAGIVTTQATTMPRATPQRTAEVRRAAPTPTMAPLMTCVVETGIPRVVAVMSVSAAPVSAAQPCIGERRVIFEPIVCTIRQPPASVPSPMAV